MPSSYFLIKGIKYKHTDPQRDASLKCKLGDKLSSNSMDKHIIAIIYQFECVQVVYFSAVVLFFLQVIIRLKCKSNYRWSQIVTVDRICYPHASINISWLSLHDWFGVLTLNYYPRQRNISRAYISKQNLWELVFVCECDDEQAPSVHMMTIYISNNPIVEL